MNPVRRLLQRIRAENRNLRGILRPDPYAKPAVLPFFSFPGGYTLLYTTKDGSTLCAQCATEALNLDIGTPDRYRLDVPVDYGTYDEGPNLYCDGCNHLLASSYGDPELPDDINDMMMNELCYCRNCDPTGSRRREAELYAQASLTL